MGAHHGTFLAVLAWISTTTTSAFQLPSVAVAPLQECYQRARCCCATTRLLLAGTDESNDWSELSRRIETLQKAEAMLTMNHTTGHRNDAASYLQLPVLSLDGLLPRQRLTGRTTDPTFSRFLQELGLGGLFGMISLNHAQRKLRRNGVLCQIQVVDAATTSGPGVVVPTAVDFVLVGIKPCRVVGPATHLRARVGRWRRAYDPDGEETRLGFDLEKFVDVPEEAASDKDASSQQTDNDLKYTDWSTVELDCALVDNDNDENDVLQLAEAILPLLDQWRELVTRTSTYDNVDVVATARVMRGQPGLRVDPAALIRNVLRDLGEQPPVEDPTALALWGAALVNPLPPLGVAPEIRGRVLEAPNAMRRLQILEWGIKRSIGNLEGTAPLL